MIAVETRLTTKRLLPGINLHNEQWFMLDCEGVWFAGLAESDIYYCLYDEKLLRQEIELLRGSKEQNGNYYLKLMTKHCGTHWVGVVGGKVKRIKEYYKQNG